MQFIPVLEPDKDDPRSAASFSVDAERFGDFLCRLWDLWLGDFEDGTPTTSIRWFESLFYTYVGMTAPECTLHRECGDYVVVEYNGDVYSCDFFVEPRWKLGNITQENLKGMLRSNKQQEFGSLKGRFSEDCASCGWLEHCFGGCTKDRIMDPTGAGQPRLCGAYQRFFEHADEHLKELATRWKLNR